MACGVAVVATTGGALPEVVGADSETGLLVAPNDPSALAQAIARLLHVSHAAGTAACYEALLAGRPLPGAPEAESKEDVGC